MNKTTTQSLVKTAMFTALILALAFIPYLGYIKLPILPIQATTVHIPVIVGSILLGPQYGAFLGGVFGLTSLINNTMSPGLISFVFSPFIQMGDGLGGSPLALVICFLPRILTGVVPYYIYNALQNKFSDKKSGRKYSLMVSGVAGSMTNTILVMSMIYIFFGHEYANAKNIPYSSVLGVVLTTVFTNGIVEAVIAALITSAVIFAFIKAGFYKPSSKASD